MDTNELQALIDNANKIVDQVKVAVEGQEPRMLLALAAFVLQRAVDEYMLKDISTNGDSESIADRLQGLYQIFRALEQYEKNTMAKLQKVMINLGGPDLWEKTQAMFSELDKINKTLDLDSISIN